MNIGSIDPSEDIGLVAYTGEEPYYSKQMEWLPVEDGVVKLTIIYNDRADRNNGKKLSGNFVITRSSSKDNFVSWQEVARVYYDNEIPSERVIYDYTVEQGVQYRYAVQQYNRHGFYSNKVYCFERDGSYNILRENGQGKVREVIVDFEDMFLYDGERQLKIRFNPKVSSFKNDLQEQKIDTIGSKYPFIFRNGNVCYKEFPISGMISFQLDNAQFFMTDEDYKQMQLERFEIPDGERKTRFQPTYEYQLFTSGYIAKSDLPLYYQQERTVYPSSINGHENLLKHTEQEGTTVIDYIAVETAVEAARLRNKHTQLFKKVAKNSYSDIYRGTVYNKNDLTGKNINSERYFKLLVLDWLSNGKPKLFRSPTEGNYVVRLMNVSLTPKDNLGRMLHDFTCTAYEIANTDYFSLKDLGIIKIDSAFTESYQWNSLNVADIFTTENYNATTKFYNVNLSGKNIYGFSCLGFEPGDVIQFIADGGSQPTEIVIGQAGSYLYDGPDIVVSIKVLPLHPNGSLPRDIQLKTKGFNYQKFDLIAGIGIHTQMGQQFVGKHDNVFSTAIVGDSGYETASNLFLEEKFEQIPASDNNAQLFDRQTWYIKDKTGYHLPSSDFVYNRNYQYYKRVPSGEKVIMSDLIYLHAKRREIIPIFMSVMNDGATKTYSFINNNFSNSNLVRFSLTPYGNGYVNYESVSADKGYPVWNQRYARLSDDERTKLYDINELVDFSMRNPDIFDKFCLFELYAPSVDAVTGEISWGRWYDRFDTPLSRGWITGIFDPYLYSQDKAQNNLNTYSGWWREDRIVSMKYDPSFNLTYQINGETFTENVSLDKTREITLTNTLTPVDLSIGSGVSMELIYRVKYIDYSMEKEKDSTVKKSKDAYLQAKAQAQANTSQYRTDKYLSQSYPLLLEKYGAEISKLNQIEAYSRVIKDLAEKALAEQKAQIPKGFLTSESVLMRSLSNDLTAIDEELSSVLLQEYSSQLSKIQQVKRNYDRYVDLNINKEIDWLGLDLFIQSGSSEEQMRESIHRSIEPYINHIYKDTRQNLFQFFSPIEDICSSGEASKKAELAEIPSNVQYVAQYKDYLNEKKWQGFFQDFTAFDKTLPVGRWIHKQTITDILWAELKDSVHSESELSKYFHIGSDYLTFPALGDLRLNDKSVYAIQNLDWYLAASRTALKNCQLIKVKYGANQKPVFQFLSDGLETLNNQLTNVLTEQQYQTQYGIPYRSTISQNLQEILSSGEEALLLGDIPLNTYKNIPKSFLETTIDSAIFGGAIVDKTALPSYLNAYCDYYQELPAYLQEKLVDIIIKYVETFRSKYQTAYTYSTYLEEHEENFTSQEVEFIEDAINKYVQERMGRNWASTGIDSAVTDFLKELRAWNSIREKVGAISGDAKTLRKEMISCIAEINKVISAKNVALQQYVAMQKKANSFVNNPDLSSSAQIRTILLQQIEIYANNYHRVLELKDYYTKQHKLLQQKAEITAYPDFLADYADIINSNARFNSDNEYQQKLQDINRYKSILPNETQNTPTQQRLVTNAWAKFVTELADAYKKMR